MRRLILSSISLVLAVILLWEDRTHAQLGPALRDTLADMYRAEIPDRPTKRVIRFGKRYDEQANLLGTSKSRVRPLAILIDESRFDGNQLCYDQKQAIVSRLTESGIATLIVWESQSETVNDRLERLTRALSKVRLEAAELNIDLNRLALIGFGSGSHRAALLATDEGRIDATGIRPESIKAVLLVDGIGYDLNAQLSHATRYQTGILRHAFPGDSVPEALSPANYVAAPNAGSFMLVSSGRIEGSLEQSALFAERLRQAGANVEVPNLSAMAWRNLCDAFASRGEENGQVMLDYLKRQLELPGSAAKAR